MGDGTAFRALSADQRAATLAQIDLLSKHLLAEYARAQADIHTRIKLGADVSGRMLWLTLALVVGVTGTALAVLLPVLAGPGSLSADWSSPVFLATLAAAFLLVFAYVVLMRQLVRSVIAHSFHIRSATAYARDHVSGGLRQLVDACVQIGGTAPDSPVHAWDAHLAADQRKGDFNGHSTSAGAGIAAMTLGCMALAGLLAAIAWLGQVFRLPAWQPSWGVAEAAERYGLIGLGIVLVLAAVTVTISAARLARRLDASQSIRPSPRAAGPATSQAAPLFAESPLDTGPLAALNQPLLRPDPPEEADSFSSLLFERRK